MLSFSDLLYGKIYLPDWIEPFIRLPEFVRLRGVRLSNVDSYEFKDFGGPSRWEHGIAVAYLAQRCATRRGLDETQKVNLMLAALLHDIATPPFAHTAEYILENFDHELETQRILSSTSSRDASPSIPIYCSQLPGFQQQCERLSKQLKLPVRPDEIAAMITGDGPLGHLICGTLDLDNADNVTRACRHLGISVDPTVPLKLADWLATQEGAVADLAQVPEPAVQAWMGYRAELYGAFFDSSEQELGRQAFLQHLMRRALKAGLSRRALIWNTDEGLLATMSTLEEPSGGRGSSLRQMTERYRLLEKTNLVLTIPIERDEDLRILRVPQAATWLEEQLSTPDLELFVSVVARRHGKVNQTSLFPPAVGAIHAFKIGSPTFKARQLPDWIRMEFPKPVPRAQIRNAVTEVIRHKIQCWVNERPWLHLDPSRRENILQNLKSNGDWSFRLSRNESMHPYPGTYVHALPATLINSLGLKGELILDPFGGTGQTAAEAIRLGGSAITSDANSIATLVAKSKLTFLPYPERQRMKSLSDEEVRSAEPVEPPVFEKRDKWHHPHTLVELCRIRSFIDQCENAVTAQFLLACLSATIPESTGRKGKQHGYFADNTPLPAEVADPPYQPAIDYFVSRVKRNIGILERYYSSIERDDRDPSTELDRVRVLQLDATNSSAADYGLPQRSVAGIVTSPPYLCMADYTLGQRLSYHWLFPDAFQADFSRELAARRHRFNPNRAPVQYFEGLERFTASASEILRPGGFLAIVIGAPEAQQFSSIDVLQRLDSITASRGFEPFWTDWRPVQWHRNHGYQRLRKEQIIVYVAR